MDSFFILREEYFETCPNVHYNGVQFNTTDESVFRKVPGAEGFTNEYDLMNLNGDIGALGELSNA